MEFYTLSKEQVSPNFQLLYQPYPQVVFQPALKDSLLLRYQVLELPLKRRFSLRDSALILPESGRNRIVAAEDLYQREQQEFNPFSSLNSQGSISRSVAVGNNQDAVLNSALNLQLNGRLGTQTTIKASISDNTVPVQAQGYTQQLRDFDRVYLEIANPNFGRLRAGDFNILSNHYFLNLEKRISGLAVDYNLGDSRAGFNLEGGLARGRFARNRFQGQEGNQGPYKLQGANGEQFIIIISGSERVYIDGVQLKRGQQFDYVIDYNAGELTFTALQPITRDKRIVVEFQYTEQNYLRSVAQASGAWNAENWKTEVRYYTEQDSKDQPISDELSDEEKAVLAQAGDDLESANISTIRPAAFDPNLAQYRLVDSLGIDSILVFSTDSNARLYNASFSFVGAKRGDYELAESNANGRVFRWVAPLNGIPQGSYLPQRQLIAPNRLQIISYRTKGEWGKTNRQKLELEGAFSNNQLNLFSNRNLSNDDGAAAKLNYSLRRSVGKGDLEFKSLYEFNNPGFITLERIRTVEFARDWNLPFNYQGALQTGALSLAYIQDSLSLGYAGEFLQSPLKNGFRQSANLNWKAARWQGLSKLSYTQTEGLGIQESFWREALESRYYWLPKSWLGAASIGEWNLKQFAEDSLSANSYSFFEYQVFQGWGDTNTSFTEIGFLQRFDDSVRTADLERYAYAYTSFMRGAWKNQWKGNLNYNIYYRSLKVEGPDPQSLQRSLTSRFSYNQPFFKRSLISQSFYESSAGTEPRRSFTYIEVPAGTGTHTHIDYNGNGIRELDEFELAPTPDLATFLRVFSPNLEFIRTSGIKIGQNLNIQAPRSWNNTQRGWKLFLRRFSSITAIQQERRSLLKGGINNLNPFQELASDSLLVAENSSLRQTIFFNRSSLIFGGDYTYSNTANRNLLSFGVEERLLAEHRLNLRYGFLDNFVLRFGGLLQSKSNQSGNFVQRNYDLDAWRQEWSISYQKGNDLTLAMSYELRQEESQGANANRLNGQNAGLELNYTLAQNISIRSELNYIYNDFEGEQNSPAAFEMLQAFRPGANAAAQIGIQRTLLKNIVIGLNYAGRFSPEVFAIHTGNVQVKAFF